MRVCFLTSSYPSHFGDYSGNFVEGIAKAIASLGHEVFVIAPRYNSAKKMEREGNLCVYRFGIGMPEHAQSLLSLGGRKGVLSVARMFVPALLTVLRIARRSDVIHAHWVLPSGIIASVIGKAIRRPVVVSAYGSDLRIAPRHPLLNQLVNMTLHNSDYFVAISRDLAYRGIESGAHPDRTVVVPDGVNLQLLPQPSQDLADKIRDEHGLNDYRIILYVGRLDRLKGLRFLIAALPLVVKHIPEARLIIVGDGPDRRNLETLANQLGVRPVALFLGSRPHFEIPNFLSIADVCVLPSLSEGLPSFIEESFVFGKPVVASCVGGVPDLVTDGVTGLLVRPCDHELLAQAITRILSDKSSAAKLGVNARAFAMKNLTSERVAAKILAIYHQVSRPGAH